jgi:hypothetical protein
MSASQRITNCHYWRLVRRRASATAVCAESWRVVALALSVFGRARMTTVDPSGSQRVARQGVWPSGPMLRAKDNRASAAFGHALRSFTYDTDEVETRPRLRSGTGALAMTTPAAAGGWLAREGSHGHDHSGRRQYAGRGGGQPEHQ